jgi:peptidoglycan/LPS O-acetylase OafA/YrhL
MGIIRLLLALSVVVEHVHAYLKINLIGGPLAVQSFFIISGFYMSMILNEKYVNENGSYKLFITNRFMRIFPIYLCVLLIAILFSTISYLIPSQSVGVKTDFENSLSMYIQYFTKMDIKTLFLLTWVNLTLFFHDVTMFLGMGTSGTLHFASDYRLTNPPLYKFLFIPQAWSIALELTFYAIAPFLVRRNIKLITAIILVSFTF